MTTVPAEVLNPRPEAGRCHTGLRRPRRPRLRHALHVPEHRCRRRRNGGHPRPAGTQRHPRQGDHLRRPAHGAHRRPAGHRPLLHGLCAHGQGQRTGNVHCLDCVDWASDAADRFVQPRHANTASAGKSCADIAKQRFGNSGPDSRGPPELIAPSRTNLQACEAGRGRACRGEYVCGGVCRRGRQRVKTWLKTGCPARGART